MPILTKKRSLAAVFFLLGSFLNIHAQNGFQFKEQKLKSNNSLTIDTIINIVLFKSDSALRKGTLVIIPNKNKIWGFKQQTILIPDTSKFKIGELKDSANFFPFRFSVNRDSADDRIIGFDAFVVDSNGIKKELKNNSITIYIKPITTPIFKSDEFEAWFFAGTNFDLFHGVKAQEFFFRSNNLLHIHKKAYLQFAFLQKQIFRY